MNAPLNPPDAKPSTSATQNAYETLRNMIVTGALMPGEKLKITALTHALKTGASPVREALSLLTSDNLVERIDQRGFRAAPINLTNFKEILALRCELEVMALRQSIANRDDAWDAQVRQSHHCMGQAAGDARFEAMHKAFHMALIAKCQGPILLKFCSQLYDLNIRYRYLAARAENYKIRDVTSEHQVILDAVLTGDADTAAEGLVRHYRVTGAYLGDMLDLV